VLVWSDWGEGDNKLDLNGLLEQCFFEIWGKIHWASERHSPRQGQWYGQLECQHEWQSHNKRAENIILILRVSMWQACMSMWMHKGSHCFSPTLKLQQSKRLDFTPFPLTSDSWSVRKLFLQTFSRLRLRTRSCWGLELDCSSLIHNAITNGTSALSHALYSEFTCVS